MNVGEILKIEKQKRKKQIRSVFPVKKQIEMLSYYLANTTLIVILA